ncbi:LytR family transcriptional regulator [Streptomyces radicis]|uniref:LytR family transcriptional regulator n=1 Tax=Streptomyces radicis TaxID=1750517 RepID=A0A3A9WEK1_9ACTN|nr:LytR family transcriptional regulator [Streptomyces radicis]RKN26513.1 LytR family transcriptional regulator [Streptomyces radicis]
MGPRRGVSDPKGRCAPVAVQTTRGQKWLWWLLLAFGVILAIIAGVALWAYQRLDGNISTDHAAARALGEEEGERPEGADEARNILVIGHDFGSGTGNARSDTVLLLHLSADGRRADAVHVPRDIVVDIPACRTEDGGHSEATTAQFNWAFQFGGAACTIRTFEGMSGIRVDHHLVIGFEGFADVVDAVGGVEVELEEAERDPNVGHDLPAGRHRLDGEQALAYVRARVFVGDGSDLNRLARQQEFLGRLYQRVTDERTVTDPTRLYPVLKAVTSAITADAGLDSLDELYALAKDLRAVPDGAFGFRTVPTVPHPTEANRLRLDERVAGRLFAAIRQDRELPPAP